MQHQASPSSLFGLVPDLFPVSVENGRKVATATFGIATIVFERRVIVIDGRGWPCTIVLRTGNGGNGGNGAKRDDAFQDASCRTCAIPYLALIFLYLQSVSIT